MNGCATKPPNESGDFKTTDLAELIKLDPSFKLDIRYATSNNLAGRAVYTEARAFLQRPAAEALAKFNCGSCDKAPVINVNDPFGLMYR